MQGAEYLSLQPAAVPKCLSLRSLAVNGRGYLEILKTMRRGSVFTKSAAPVLMIQKIERKPTISVALLLVRGVGINKSSGNQKTDSCWKSCKVVEQCEES